MKPASPTRASGPSQQPVTPGKPTGFGTFGGVFTPSILTILGVIMYLRFGWVVGQVGLVKTLLIVTLSTGITFLTALSISAIATDQRVRTGGAYYMISRSLGVEAGGAVGIPLYFAQALSVALYTIGFAESLTGVFPVLNLKITALVTTVGVAVVAIVSARLAIRAQYFIMGAIALSLLSLLFGKPIEQTDVEIWRGADPSTGFWTVFAIFFPAVTGIMAGVNMSGDLREPGKAIPRGTLAAIGVGYVIYMGLPLVLASRADAATLIEDPLVMRRMALWGDAILLGVWGATLSSAMGSILGAPRVLQALARDGILPRSLRWLGKGAGVEDEPRVGTTVTLGVALAAVALGDLNLIAPILSMFFLTTYGVLNVVAGIERLLGSPSFRPKFKVHWLFSLMGAIGCVAVMLLINPAATTVAAVVVLAIFVWLERREMTAAWGDVRRGIWMAVTRTGLLRLQSPVDPKNWRPHLMVFSGAPSRRWHLIDLASSFTHDRGLMTVATVLPSETVTQERQNSMETAVQEYLEKRGIQALVRVAPGEDTFEGACQLVEKYGLGSVVPNTVLLGDTEEEGSYEDYCRMITRFHELKRNVLILRNLERRFPERRRRIDVWWGGLQNNGGLMLILAYLLRTSLRWRGAQVCLKMVAANPTAAEGCRANLNQIIEQARTGAKVEILVAEGETFEEVLQRSSNDADLVLLGIATPDESFPGYFRNLQQRVEGLPPTLFTLAAEDLAFGEVLLERPGEGAV